MPSNTTFWSWMFQDEELAIKVARAREAGADALMAEIVDIADTHEKGVRIVTDEEGKVKRIEEDMLGHRKLRIDARVKYAQMIAPRKYGVKLDLTSGGEKLPAATQNVALVDVRMQSLIALAAARQAQGLIIEHQPEEDDLGSVMS